jgi:hypothetical protein
MASRSAATRPAAACAELMSADWRFRVKVGRLMVTPAET